MALKLEVAITHLVNNWRAILYKLLKYAGVGGLSVVVYVGGVYVGTSLTDYDGLLVNFTCYTLATALNYWLNYYWTFKSGASHKTTLVKFTLLLLFGLILNTAFIYLMQSQFDLPIWVGALVFSIGWPLFAFILNLSFVFKDS